MGNCSTVIGVIPARYGATRFTGKPLAQLCGKPMIQWVYERASQSRLLQDLFVAVDDERILKCVHDFGGKAVMTDSHHQSGTDRIAEAVSNMDVAVVVNIQGDQPLINPVMIDEAVQPLLSDPSINMSTIKTILNPEFYHDTGTVKVVVDKDSYALYFSRSLIPYPRMTENLRIYEHVGLYVYRKEFLLKISILPQTELEITESLEQLRVLENGYRIFVVETSCENAAGVSVDTPEDLKRVEQLMRAVH
jgi:3-deoxy-manno-octulosonate cytidylyltransferase (CMP-KDO synthetase)